MTKKTQSKHLTTLEKHFAEDNPTLHKAVSVFHELDQLEYDLGLLENEATTAIQYSWWPIFSVIGGTSPAKAKFITEYFHHNNALGAYQASTHKFTVLQHNNQNNPVTLPGTALDIDHRLPFYQISKKIEKQARGEEKNINSYLELKTINSDKLKGKLFIDAPEYGNQNPTHPVTTLLTSHIIEISDLVLVFCDIFDTEPDWVDALVNNILTHQDANKFLYIVDNSSSHNETVKAWQKRLADLGIKTGQFIALSSQTELSDPQNQENLALIQQRMSNLEHYRSYRILHSLEKNIRDINDVFMPEIEQAIAIWKDRVNFSSLLILGFIATLMLFAEIQMGFFAILFDPIIGPIALLTLIGFMVPIHIMISKLQAKLIISRLQDRQKELHLPENLAAVFEKSLTKSNMLLPITTPVGWNKKTKARLNKLAEKATELVLMLNDGFHVYDDQTPIATAEPQKTNELFL